MQPYENVKKNLKEIIINNFIGGLSWALGATIGLSIILAILGFVGGRLNFVPMVGTFVAEVSSFVQQHNKQTPTPKTNNL